MNFIKKTHIVCIAFFMAMSTFVFSGEIARFEDDPVDEAVEVIVPAPQNAAEVLSGMLSRLPVEPVVLTGTLTLRKQRGIPVKELEYKMTLCWGASPATAEYALYDKFGRLVRTLAITRDSDGKLRMSSTDSDGNKEQPPVLTESIEGTDMTWLDISLAYLWWRDAELEGENEFRGVLCDTVIVRPPEKIEGITAMRLWIDRKHGLLRQAEQIGMNGECTRSMWVASIGKINDRYMIRNMEVKRSGRTGLMTKLHVETLETP